jgi:hypothetical protein
VNALLIASYSSPRSMFHCTTRRNLPSLAASGKSGFTPRADAALLTNGVVNKRCNLFCKAAGGVSCSYSWMSSLCVSNSGGAVCCAATGAAFNKQANEASSKSLRATARPLRPARKFTGFI